MDLTKKEVEVLQELLILIYKLINQNKIFKSLYFRDMDIDEQLENKSHLINELNKLEDPEKMLKSCIIELEELKENKKVNKDFIYKILAEYKLRDLKMKYGIKDITDIDKLGIETILEQI